MIELPSGPAVLNDRLAALEDPILAERLFRENPSLFADEPEPPRTQREVLKWATRRVGTAVIAVTAAVSISAGYVWSESTRHPAPATQPVQRAAAILPIVHPRAVGQHHLTPRAPAHVTHHAAGVIHHAAPVVHHSAPVVYVAPVVHPQPDREALMLRARLRAQELELIRLRAQTAAARAAARTAQAHAAAPQHRIAVSPAAAPQGRPQSEPSGATTTATATGTAPGSGAAPDDRPLPDSTGGVKTPPTSPGGVWNERIPRGGPLGGIPPILVGVPRDSCTPQGGRIGTVMQAVQIIQAMSRQH